METAKKMVDQTTGAITSEATKPAQVFTLYTLGADFERFIEEMLAMGGEISEDMEQRWSELLAGLHQKGSGVYRVIRRMESELAGYKSERQRLQAMEKATEKSIERLKGRMMDAMLRAELSEIKTDIGKLKVQHSTPSLRLLCSPEALPKHFQKVKIEADNAALRAALADEDPVATGVAVIEQGTHLRLY